MGLLSKATVENINNLCQKYKNKKNKNKLLIELKKEANKNNPANRTIASRFSEIKKIVSKYISDKSFLNEIKPPDKLTQILRIENEKVRDKKKQIIVKESLIKNINEYKNSDDMYKLFIYLLLVTGRRTIELLTSDFYEKKNKLFIDGIRKRSDTGNNCEIHTLGNHKIILSKIKKIQKETKNTSTETFHRTLLRKIKKNIGEDVRPHMLRGIYVNYLFKFYNTKNEKINTFIMNKLCHENIDSSLSYTGYILDFDKNILKNTKSEQ